MCGADWAGWCPLDRPAEHPGNRTILLGRIPSRAQKSGGIGELPSEEPTNGLQLEGSMQLQRERIGSERSGLTGLLLCLLGGLVVGAGIMYLADPDRGARRRSLVRDKARRYARQTGTSIRRQAHWIRNRAQGLAAETRAAMQHEDVDDDRLHERVRSIVGRAVMHPRAITVEAIGGIITLSGPVLAHEVDELID